MQHNNSENDIGLIGRLGRDPEFTEFANGRKRAVFTLATYHPVRNESGNGTNAATDWHKIVAFGKLAENARDHLSKGRRIRVRGHLRYFKPQMAPGAEHQAKLAEIVADSFMFLDQKSETAQTSTAAQTVAEAAPVVPSVPVPTQTELPLVQATNPTPAPAVVAAATKPAVDGVPAEISDIIDNTQVVDMSK